jgi:hypothetical protein
VGEFLGGALNAYPLMRFALLAFCLGERLTGEQFATAAKETVPAQALENSGLLEFLDRDLPLQLLCKSALALWP